MPHSSAVGHAVIVLRFASGSLAHRLVLYTARHSKPKFACSFAPSRASRSPSLCGRDAIATLKLKLQLYCGEEIAMGPGKAALLQAIDKTGSISAAGRELGMSYRRAW